MEPSSQPLRWRRVIEYRLSFGELDFGFDDKGALAVGVGKGVSRCLPAVAVALVLGILSLSLWR